MKRLLLGFPGQGSQKLNAGRTLAAAFPNSAGRVFAQVDDVLDGLFTKVVWNDSIPPQEKEKLLSATANTQPIVLACSIAVLSALREAANFEVNAATTGCLVGHSLGEFTALVAADALDFVDAVKLVRRRGQVMQSAADKWGRKPAMSAVLGLSWMDAKEIEKSCPPGMLVEAVCANGPEQVVLAGCDEGVTWGIERARTLHKAKKGLKVNVSCPFHSSVMAPAVAVFKQDLDGIKIKRPNVPIVFCLDSKMKDEPEGIKAALLQGMTSPVMWAESVKASSRLFGPLVFREMGGDTLKFGVKNVPNLEAEKPIRALAEDIASFVC